MKNVLTFLKDCGTFYLATTDANQPRVRPFGAIAEFEGKLYIVTSNKKKVFDQMLKNPKVEISATLKDKWIRLEGNAIRHDSLAAREEMIASNPILSNMYSANDGIMEVFYIENASAKICSFNAEAEEIKF